MIVEKNYLVFRVAPEGPARIVLLTVDGVPAVDYPMPLSQHGDRTAYVDVRRFRGRELEILVDPACPYSLGFCDELPLKELYAERDRQLVHFTPPFGQMNDPNGLVYYEGKWHAFFQYFPPSPRISRENLWIRHEWGHIVSDDLLHWRLLPQALFHSPLGSVWSGSAVVDTRNVSGLKENEHDPLLLFYTLGGEKTVVSDAENHQRMAYSTDGGVTFRLYPEPILQNIPLKEGKIGAWEANRDPKVEWCEELNCYLLSVYGGIGDVYLLLSSRDLLHWRELCRIPLAEDNECPDLYPLTASDGRRLWVFSGAHHRYLVGNMTEKGFEPIQPAAELWGRYDGYAGQTFFGAPKRINIDWLRLGYEHGSDYWGGFGIPTEVSLLKSDERYVLCQTPIDLTPITEAYEERELRTEELQLAETPYAITVEAEYAPNAKILIDVFGIPLVLDAEKGCGNIGTSAAPLPPDGNLLRATVLYDRRSVEVFFGRGESGLILAENCNFADRMLRITSSVRGRVALRKLAPCLPS